MTRDNEAARILRALASDLRPHPWLTRPRREAIEHKQRQLYELLPEPSAIESDPDDAADVARADALIFAKQIGVGRVPLVSGSTGEHHSPPPITREAIEDAADALAGKPETPTRPAGKRKTTGKRGPYKTPYDPKADAKLARDWQAAKRSGTQTVAEFCKDRGLDEIDVREALERHRKRERRAAGKRK